MLSHRPIAARISTYQQKYLDTIRSAEVQLSDGDNQSTNESLDWNDEGNLIQEVGGLIQEGSETEVRGFIFC